MTDIIKSILAINPNAEVTVKADDIKQITWHGDTAPIAETDILANQRDRASAYPSIAEQLDDLYHNGIDGWKSTIKAIKDKYPKG